VEESCAQHDLESIAPSVCTGPNILLAPKSCFSILSCLQPGTAKEQVAGRTYPPETEEWLIWKHRSCWDERCQLRARLQLICCGTIRTRRKPWIRGSRRLGCRKAARWWTNVNPRYIWAAEVEEGCMPTTQRWLWSMKYPISAGLQWSTSGGGTPHGHLQDLCSFHPQPAVGTASAVFGQLSNYLLCNCPEQGVKHGRRAAQVRKEDATLCRAMSSCLLSLLASPANRL